MYSSFNTPILLITFNRPNHTRRVWEEIKKQHPQKVYVFQDGAREGNDSDVEKCQTVRDIFSEERDWDCEIKTFYSDVNLGCGKGPITGISWFFENVEQGIIMEDDCLPHSDFFQFCEDMLVLYQQNKEVMAVGTTTYHDNYPCVNSYLFTKYFTGGAWATWRRAWDGFSFDLESVDLNSFKRLISQQFYSSAETNWWVKKLWQIKNDTSKKSYWDYQMQIHLLLNNGVAIRPQKNIISNIGFDLEGTHTHQNDSRGDREVYACYPLTHPTKIEVNKRNDYLYMAKEYQKRLDKRVIVSIYDFMNQNDGVFKQTLNFYKSIKRKWKNR